jgi:hypothetical protein
MYKRKQQKKLSNRALQRAAEKEVADFLRSNNKPKTYTLFLKEHRMITVLDRISDFFEEEEHYLEDFCKGTKLAADEVKETWKSFYNGIGVISVKNYKHNPYMFKLNTEVAQVYVLFLRMVSQIIYEIKRKEKAGIPEYIDELLAFIIIELALYNYLLEPYSDKNIIEIYDMIV